MTKGFCVFLAHILLQLSALMVYGQNLDRATLRGRVTDESGAVLPDVTLVLRNEATDHTRETVSGKLGDFSLPFVPAGSYTLLATREGFSRLGLEGIRLVTNQELDVALVLKVGDFATQVTVTADGKRIETTSGTVRHDVADQELKDLPFLLGRMGLRGVLYMLPLLTPGANSIDSLALSNPGGRGGRVSINGSPVASMGFTFDGTENYDTLAGGAATRGPNPDALGEFSALTHTFKAESGNYPVIINLQTKGGGNQFHGQLRGIYRDPSLDARDFFSQEDSSGQITRVAGFQLSGPISLPRIYQGRNRTFFFVDVERSRWRFSYADRQTVIDDAQRQGDFSALPASLWPRDPQTGAVFLNGRIPESRLLSQSRFFIQEFVPRATQGSEWVETRTQTERGTQAVMRFDHQLAPRDTVNTSLFVEDSTLNYPFGLSARLKGKGSHNNLAAHYVHSFSPEVTNSFTFGWSRSNGQEIVAGKHDDANLADYGFNIYQDPSAPTGFPAVYLPATNYFDPGGYLGDYRQTIGSLKDDVAMIKSRHAIKFGGDARWWRKLDLSTAQPYVTFTDQNPFGSGNEVGDFLLGIPSEYYQGTGQVARSRRFLTSLYLQDDLKLRPDLVLNLGLRYELSCPWSDADGRNAVFRPGSKSRVFANAPPGILFPGDDDPWANKPLGYGQSPVDANNFAPRVGLAFSPNTGSGLWRTLLGGSGRSSVRAGYGLYYYPSRGGGRSLGRLPPWHTFVILNSTQIHDNGGTFANPWGSAKDPFRGRVSDRHFDLPVQLLSYRELGVREPYLQQWSLSVQRQLLKEMTFELAYLGNRGVHLHRRFEANPGRLVPNADPFDVDTRRQHPDFGSVTGFTSDGTSSHNALQVRLTRRFSSRLQFNSHYVWSKTLDNAGGAPPQIENYGDRDITPWSRANGDRRHQFVFYGSWELPTWQQSIAKWLTSGWQANAIVRIGSGQPFNLRNAFDSTLMGRPPGSPDIIGPYRKLNPREVNTFLLPNGRSATGNFFFDPSVFRTVSPEGPEEARLGNLGRNVFTGPGTNNVDLSFLKEIRIRERHRFTIRLDALNLFNHAQFTVSYYASQFTDSAFFGRSTPQTAGPRQIQIYVRYSF